LERLLDLTPNDEQAIRLAHQLRDRLLRAAKKRVQEDDYSGALRLLDDVPTIALNDDVEKLAAQARELNWLMTNMRLAAVVDDTVVTLAERLARMRPGNQKAAQLLAKLKARHASRSSNTVRVAPDWAVPREPYLGFPVEWLSGMRRVGLSEEASKAFTDNPACYFVACGLALQGLEVTSITSNLLASGQQSGVLRKLRFGRTRPPQTAWGLDLGAHSLKAVRIRRGDDDRPVVDACCRIEHEDWNKIDEEGASNTQKFASSLEQFLSRHPIEGEEKVAVSLPGSLILGRFFDLPPVEENRVEDAVRYEAAGQIPFDLQDVKWSYQAFGLGDDQAAESRKRRIVLQAAKSHHVQDLTLLCEQAGFKPAIVQSDCAALHNLLAHEFLEQDASSRDCLAVLDVGAANTNLVVTSPQSAWFRSLGVAGETLTSALVRAFQLTRDQAEALKCQPGRAKQLYPVYEALDPILTTLVEEVQRSLKVHHRLYPDLSVKRMLGAGGGFAMHGLLRRLRTGR
jgi:type IV pilus assembly protein PilM